MCWKYTGATANGCSTAPSGATSYTYDADGNQLFGRGFDALSRLTTIGSNSMSYLTPGNQELVADGSTSLQNSLLGLMREVPASGSAIAYTRDPSGAALAQRSSTAKQWIFNDNLGSLVSLADDNANSLTRIDSYDPDGNPSSTTAGLGGSHADDDLGLAGGYTTKAGGLLHLGARFYDPAIARWTQQDPLSQGASMQQANRYGYAGDDSVNVVDPAGLYDLKSTIDKCGEGAAQSALLTGPEDAGAGCAVGAASDALKQAGCDSCADALDIVGGAKDLADSGDGPLQKGFNSLKKAFG